MVVAGEFGGVECGVLVCLVSKKMVVGWVYLFFDGAVLHIFPHDCDASGIDVELPSVRRSTVVDGSFVGDVLVGEALVDYTGSGNPWVVVVRDCRAGGVGLGLDCAASTEYVVLLARLVRSKVYAPVWFRFCWLPSWL